MKPFRYLKTYLARQYVKLYSEDLFIGVTGSYGKTACVAACLSVCGQKYKTIATRSNLDPLVSIPQTLLRVNPTVKKVILEMGVKCKGEMDFYLSEVRPKIAVYTKASYAPAETMVTPPEILEERGKLIESLKETGVAILNGDDPASKKLAEKCKGRVFFYGTDPQTCTIWAGNIKLENFATTFELNLGVERVKVNLKLLGAYQVYPALAGALLGVVLDIPITKIKPALEAIEPEEHRMQVLGGPNNSILLDDTYNNSPAALENAIETLLQIPARRRIVVLGEIKDLGEFSETMHRQIARQIYKEKLDFVFLGQGDTDFIADELKLLGFWEERIEADLKNSELVSRLLKTLGKGDVCLINGSRSLRLDEVVKRIAKKP